MMLRRTLQQARAALDEAACILEENGMHALRRRVDDVTRAVEDVERHDAPRLGTIRANIRAGHFAQALAGASSLHDPEVRAHVLHEISSALLASGRGG